MKAAKPSPVIIREMLLADLATVYELGSRLFRAEDTPTLYRCWDEENVLKLYEHHRETCLVAMVSDEIVGFALGQHHGQARQRLAIRLVGLVGS